MNTPTPTQMKWLRLADAGMNAADKQEFIFSLFRKKQWDSISRYVTRQGGHVTMTDEGRAVLKVFHETH